MSDFNKGHTSEEVALMAEYFGYKGVPNWIFLGALQEWKLSSNTVLSNAKEWEANGKPYREELGKSHVTALSINTDIKKEK